MRVFLALLLSLYALRSTAHDTLMLQTEFAAYDELDGAIAGRLVRELGRQAILIAARDEFGVATRDESLGDTIDDEESDVILLYPRVRSRWNDGIYVELHDASRPDLIQFAYAPSSPRLGRRTIYPLLAESWEEASRNVLVEALKSLGLEAHEPSFNPNNVPDSEVERLLDQLNFVSQYAAVRRAHRSIAENGASVEWLAVLVRGYANLGTLTEHHWTSAPEAFYARALLYAERARALAPDHPLTPLLSPYALATSGAHGAALDRIEETDDWGEEDPPYWAAVIEPACRFQISELQRLGEDSQELKSLASWSVVCLDRVTSTHQSFGDKARCALAANPDAYGAYSSLVTLAPTLGDVRYGATTAPEVLGRYLPERISEMSDLPETVRNSLEEADPNATKQADWLNPLAGVLARRSHTPFTNTPNRLIDSLRDADGIGVDAGEPSLGALASLVEEEQFVAASNYCQSISNAVESSLEDEVAELVELMRGHRFRAHLQYYGLSVTEQHNPDRVAEVFADTVIADPRHNMLQLMRQTRDLEPREGEGMSLGHSASWSALWSYDFRLPSLRVEHRGGNNLWWKKLSQKQKRGWAPRYKAVTPYSPHWLRQEMLYTKDPTPEQLEDWAVMIDQPDKDGYLCGKLGHLYGRSGDIENAIHWYRVSLSVDPDPTVAYDFAYLLRQQGRNKEWREMIDHYLQTQEDRGLGHSRLQRYLAKTLMREEGKYEEALPYAVAAAETYSSSAMAIAVEAYEGLANFEQADRWAKELSTHYPSTGGHIWFYFRKRTAYGDPKEARPYYDQTLAAASEEKMVWDKACAPLFQGDTNQAFLEALKMKDRTKDLYWYVMSTILAYELQDKQKLKRETESLSNLIENRPELYGPAHLSLAAVCCEAIESGNFSEEQTEIEKRLAAVSPGHRRDYQMFIGRTLQLLNDESSFDKELLRASATAPPIEAISATIAGHYLGQVDSVSRTEPVAP